jgi:hypothetical protein
MRLARGLMTIRLAGLTVRLEVQVKVLLGLLRRHSRVVCLAAVQAVLQGQRVLAAGRAAAAAAAALLLCCQSMQCCRHCRMWRRQQVPGRHWL